MKQRGGSKGAEEDSFVQFSTHPYLAVEGAKLLCADTDVSPGF